MFTAIGWFGMITFLVAYGLVANSKLKSTGIAYNGMNVIGAIAIAVSLFPVKAWPTIALEVCFMLIGIHAIVRKLRT